MTTKQKPVWRMNTGTGVPSDLGDVLILRSGLIRAVRNTKGGFGDLKNIRWEKTGIGSDILAYQTNRTKAAKYERVECDCDEGTIHLKGGYHTKCGLCNGKGYTMEAIK